MVYAYIRVSTDKQTVENQRFEVQKFATEKGLTGDICIYINAERRAAYYTVNQEGSDEYKVDLGNL